MAVAVRGDAAGAIGDGRTGADEMLGEKPCDLTAEFLFAGESDEPMQ